MQIPSAAPVGAQCARHPDRPAPQTCPRCGSFMCPECAGVGADGRCPGCRERFGAFPLTRHDFDFGRLWDLAFEAWKREWVMLVVCFILLMMVGMVGAIVSSVFQQLGMAMAGIKQPTGAEDLDLSGLLPFFAVAGFGQLLGTLINVVVQGVVQLGVLRICFDVLHGGKANLERLFSQLKRLPDFIVSQLIVLFAVNLPMLLLLLLPIGAAMLMLGLTSVDALKQLDPNPGLIVAAVLVVLLGLAVNAALAIYVLLPLTLVPAEIVYGGASGVEAIKRAWALASGHRLSLLAVWVVGALVWLLGAAACCVGILPAYGLVQLLSAALYLALRQGSDLPPPVQG